MGMIANLSPVSPAMRGFNVSCCSLVDKQHCRYTASTWFAAPDLLNNTRGARLINVMNSQNGL